VQPRWYEKIGVSYTFNALNRISFYDSTLNLGKIKLSDFDNGFKHSIPISANYQVLKYLNSSFNFNYNEYWYTKRDFKQYNFEENRLDTQRTAGFFTARDFSMSTSLSTRIYGIKLFKKGVIRGIRHVISPSISFPFQPDFGGGIGNYYYSTFIDSNRNIGRFSYYEEGRDVIGGGPPDGKFGGIKFNLGNTLQLKARNRKDSVNGVRKISLIDGLDFAGSYNFAVDSFQWGNVSVAYRTNLFENINISGSMSFDPYTTDTSNGARRKETYYQTHGKILQFRSANVGINASLPTKKQNTALTKANDEQLQAIGNRYNMYADFNIPWTLRIRYNVSLNKRFLFKPFRDTLEFSQDINFDGEINLTEKWRIGFSSGFEFRTKEITPTSINIFRDLHCWQMSLGLIPFGFRKSYNFSLNVKSSVLQDLKLVRRKDFRDNIQ
jgi:hypothetical protein